jgi:hypothetical protein
LIDLATWFVEGSHQLSSASTRMERQFVVFKGYQLSSAEYPSERQLMIFKGQAQVEANGYELQKESQWT